MIIKMMPFVDQVNKIVLVNLLKCFFGKYQIWKYEGK